MPDPPGEAGCALIPTGYGASAYTCVRSLGRRGVGSIVASEHRNVPAATSKYCTEAVTVPDKRADGSAYLSALLALAERPDVRTVVPVRPEDGYLLSRYRAEFDEHVSLVVPSMEKLTTVHDRLRLAAVAEEAGVPVPETRLLSEVDDWEGEHIIKSRYNVLAGTLADGLGDHALDVKKDWFHVIPGAPPDLPAVRQAMGHEPIVQEFIPKAGEYVFGALYAAGEPLSTYQHRQIRGNAYTGGGGVYRKTVDVPALESVATTLLDALEWHGLACIEYMEDRRTGEFVLTEINPRMWQSLPVAVRAGADFPYHYWLHATGRADEIANGYELDVGSHLLAGELGYFLSLLTDDSPIVSRPSVARTGLEIVLSCLVDPHFDYLNLDDPRPFVAGVGAKLRSGFKR